MSALAPTLLDPLRTSRGPAPSPHRPIENDGCPDRRKVVHRGTSPTNDGGGSEDGPAPDHDAAPPDRRKIIHRSPAADRSGRSPGGSADGTVPDQNAAPPDRRKIVHQSPTARALAATLMLLALLGSVVDALPLHADADDHEELIESTGHVEVQEANAAAGLFALWTLVVAGWDAIAVGDICDDCNLPVDDGCKCVCYSGGYDPDDPACQF